MFSEIFVLMAQSFLGHLKHNVRIAAVWQLFVQEQLQRLLQNASSLLNREQEGFIRRVVLLLQRGNLQSGDAVEEQWDKVDQSLRHLVSFEEMLAKTAFNEALAAALSGETPDEVFFPDIDDEFGSLNERLFDLPPGDHSRAVAKTLAAVHVISQGWFQIGKAEDDLDIAKARLADVPLLVKAIEDLRDEVILEVLAKFMGAVAEAAWWTYLVNEASRETASTSHIIGFKNLAEQQLALLSIIEQDRQNVRY